MAEINHQQFDMIPSPEHRHPDLPFESTLRLKGGRLLIITGVLLFSILLSWLGTKIDPLYVAALGSLPVLLAGYFYLLRHNRLYPLVILLAGLFIPFSLPTGTGSRLVISLVLTTAFTVGWVLKMLLADRKLYLFPFPINRPLLMFMAVTIFSIPWSILLRDDGLYIWRTFTIVQITSAIVMIMLPVAYLMVGNLVRDVGVIKSMVSVMLFAGVAGLLSEISGLNLPVNTGGMFSLWVVALAYALALFDRSLKPSQRAALFLLAAAWLIWKLGFNISWVAGWLPPLVTVAVLSFLKSKKVFLIFLVLLAVVMMIAWDYIQDVYFEEREESVNTRLEAWRLNWTITREHWLLGTGPAGYAVYYMSYFPTRAMATHSNYIDILSQLGVIGFALFLWFFAAKLRMGYRLMKRVQGQYDTSQALVNAALAGTIACLVIMAFGDWLFPFAYTQSIAGFDYAVYNWLFMGIILFFYRRTDPINGTLAEQG